MTVYCPNCGKPNTNEAQSCASCGTQLSKPKSSGPKFKGTMMMTSPAAPPAAAAAPAPAPAPAPAAAPGGPVQAGAPKKKDMAFQATMLGPMTPPPGSAPGATPGGFGAPPAAAPAPAGFGAPPAAAPAPSGFGAPPAAAPAPGGFGAPPAAAPAPGGFGAPPDLAPAPGGFGAPPPAAGGFGAPTPAPGGFGAPGAAAPTAGGFGSAPEAAPAQGGFDGATPAPGFGGGTPAPGFGAAPGASAGGFGAQAGQPTGAGGFGGAPAGGGAPPQGSGSAPSSGGGGKKKIIIGVGVGCLLAIIIACSLGAFLCYKAKNAAQGAGSDIAAELNRFTLTLTLSSIQASCRVDPSGAGTASSFHPQVFPQLQASACQVDDNTIAAIGDGTRSEAHGVAGSDTEAVATSVGAELNKCYLYTSGGAKIAGCIFPDGFKLIALENPAAVQ